MTTTATQTATKQRTPAAQARRTAALQRVYDYLLKQPATATKHS